MDEMQRAFNVTTSALLETMRVADERDLKQNERIKIIERQVEKMQQTIDSLENVLNDLKFQVSSKKKERRKVRFFEVQI